MRSKGGEGKKDVPKVGGTKVKEEKEQAWRMGEKGIAWREIKGVLTLRRRVCENAHVALKE